MSCLLFAALTVGLIGVPLGEDEPKLPGLKIEFPQVAGLSRQKVNVFKDAALGYSVGYFGEKSTLVVTVYVYNLGRAKIPDGPGSDAVKAEMLDSLHSLEANKTSGRYKTLSPLGETITTPARKGGLEFRRKRYEVEIDKEGPGTTELYLTGYKDYFIKLRITYVDKDKMECEKLVAQLLEALTKELK